MKKTSIIISCVIIVVMALFYGNMYRNGTFNEVEFEEKSNVIHTMQGVWVEGSFLKHPDEDRFFEVQEKLIKTLGQKKISIYYEINPTKDNHQQFKALMGVECDKNEALLVDTFKIVDISFKNVICAKQQVNPSFQRVHGKLMEYGEENNIKTNQNSMFEQFSETEFYAEISVKK